MEKMAITLAGLGAKTREALREYRESFRNETGEELADNAGVYVTVYLKETAESGKYGICRVHVGGDLSVPEGDACEAWELADIDDWYQEDWCCVYDYDEQRWVTAGEYKASHNGLLTVSLYGVMKKAKEGLRRYEEEHGVKLRPDEKFAFSVLLEESTAGALDYRVAAVEAEAALEPGEQSCSGYCAPADLRRIEDFFFTDMAFVCLPDGKRIKLAQYVKDNSLAADRSSGTWIIG